MTEILCDNVVFHFNKAHLTDPTIPMWVVKTKGKTFYVNHVDCNLPWSTKETPNNPHTKGSIKIKDCLLTIDQNNCASIDRPTAEQRRRLSGQSDPIRIIFGSIFKLNFDAVCERYQISIERELKVVGDCGSVFWLAQLPDSTSLTTLILAMPDHAIRSLMPNEGYYQLMDTAEGYEVWDPFEDNSY